jgi:hypothetical protein
MYEARKPPSRHRTFMQSTINSTILHDIPTTVFSPLHMVLVCLTNCTNCGTDATRRCTGCMDTPEYQPGDSASVVYCGRDCQREHWSSHKAHCNAMRQRRKLLRAANILKAALLTHREAVYNIDLTKADFQDGILRLYQNPRSIVVLQRGGSCT